MTSIIFNARNAESRVQGTERQTLAGIVHGMAMLVLRGLSAEQIVQCGEAGHPLIEQAERVLAARSAGGHSHQMMLERMLDAYFRAAVTDNQDCAFPDIDDRTVALNTALALGAPPVRLAARIHAQCETYLWIEGSDEPAISRIIAEAMKSGLFRPGLGWGRAQDLLRSPDIGEVVLSYGAASDFPNSAIAISDELPAVDVALVDASGTSAMETEHATAAWDERELVWAQMTRDEQWNAGMAGLRARGDAWRLTAANIAARDFRLGDGRTAADLVRAAA